MLSSVGSSRPTLRSAPPTGAADPSGAQPAGGETPASETSQDVVAIEGGLATAPGVPEPSPEGKTIKLDTAVRLSPEAIHAQQALTGVHLAAEGLEMAHVVAGALLGGVAGQGLVCVGMTGLGVMQIVDGVREKSAMEVLEGTGTVLLGARSGLAALSAAGEQFGLPVLESVAHHAHGVLAPLGVAHGSIEVLVGGKTLIDGVKSGSRDTMMAGGMSVGLGASVIAASLGAGLPAVLAGAAFLTGKIVCEHGEEISQHLQLRSED